MSNKTNKFLAAIKDHQNSKTNEKFTGVLSDYLSILEETTKKYLEEKYEDIPTISMLFESVEDLENRALKVKNIIGKDTSNIIRTKTYMGGGTLPNKSFPSIALHIIGKANALEEKFRKEGLIGRIENDKFLLDFRSIMKKDDDQLIKIINEVINK